MGAHLTAIGFPVQVELTEQIRTLLGVSGSLGSTPDGSMQVLVSEDVSGARTTLTLEQKTVTCLTPSFRPGARLRCTVNGFGVDECPWERPLLVEVLDEHGEMVYPLAVQIEDLALGDDRYAGPAITLEVAALAESLEVYPDETSYRATGTRFSSRSVIPSGLFAIPGSEGEADFRPSPRMLMTGEVIRSALVRNEFLGGGFVRMTVASYGATYEVAAAVDDLLSGPTGLLVPQPGAIVNGQFWLSGRLVPADVVDERVATAATQLPE